MKFISIYKGNVIKKVVGKKYWINPFKLFQKYSTQDSCEDLNQNKSFFCS